MEAGKSHNLLSASWRLGKQGGGVPDSDRRPENQGDLMVQVPVQGQEKTNSSSTVWKTEFNLALPFCFIQALNELDDACPHRGGPPALLRPPSQMLTSFGNTLTDTPRGNV